MYLYSKMLLSLYKAKAIICQPNFQIVIHLLKRLDPNKHLDSQMWEKGKRMQKSPRLWESLCPSTLASHTYFLPVLYLNSEQSSKAALKAFSPSGKKKRKAEANLRMYLFWVLAACIIRCLALYQTERHSWCRQSVRPITLIKDLLTTCTDFLKLPKTVINRE